MSINAAMTTTVPQPRTGGGGGTVDRYDLFNAWPTAAAAGGNDVLQQEWSIVYEGIQR